METSSLPALNAILNATSAALVCAGLGSIRAKRVALHRGCMVAAVGTSSVFLVSYLWYHAQVGSIPFTGTGWIRPVYFTVLITHTVLAVAIVPLVLRTVFLAVRNRLAEHTAIARWTAPLWLYVSVSGVVVYYLLYQSPWRA